LKVLRKKDSASGKEEITLQNFPFPTLSSIGLDETPGQEPSEASVWKGGGGDTSLRL
jgi:hypothetical protein